MTLRTNGEGKTTKYGYDFENRPTTIMDPLEETLYSLHGEVWV